MIISMVILIIYFMITDLLFLKRFFHHTQLHIIVCYVGENIFYFHSAETIHNIYVIWIFYIVISPREDTGCLSREYILRIPSVS